MLYYVGIDASEGIDVNKMRASKECDIYHSCYFLNYSFKFQPNMCNRCHDLLMMSINFSDIAILNINPFRTAKAATNGNHRLCRKTKPQVKCH